MTQGRGGEPLVQAGLPASMRRVAGLTLAAILLSALAAALWTVLRVNGALS